MKVLVGMERIEDTVENHELDEPFIVASCLVSDARDGLHSDYKTDSRSLRLFLIYRHWSLNYTLYTLILVQHALAFFEGIGRKRTEADSTAYAVTTIIEVTCLVYYISRIVLAASVLPATRFWHDAKNIVVIVAIFLTFCDIIMFFGVNPDYAVRWSPILRPLFIVNFAESRQVSSFNTMCKRCIKQDYRS